MAQNGSDGTDTDADKANNLASIFEPLSADGELYLVNNTYIPLLIQISRSYFAHMSTNDRVRGTAAQYLRRYYITHSLMEPISAFSENKPSTLDTVTLILLASVYLAMKVHDEYISLSDFVARIHDKGAREGLRGAGEVTVDSMKKAEATLTRTLRFCFEVRHASLGLRGLELELNVLANGKGEGSVAELTKQFLNLVTTTSVPKDITISDAEAEQLKLRSLRSRVGDALNATAVTLKTVVHTTDVYFLYTPSQILFAALMMADETLCLWYLATKFPTPLDASSNDTEGGRQCAFEMRDKVFATIRSCMEVLTAAQADQVDKAEQAALKELLEKSQRLVANATDDNESDESKSVKRHGIDAGFSSSDEDGELVDGKMKKKKRRRIEDDDIFGGPL